MCVCVNCSVLWQALRVVIQQTTLITVEGAPFTLFSTEVGREDGKGWGKKQWKADDAQREGNRGWGKRGSSWWQERSTSIMTKTGREEWEQKVKCNRRVERIWVSVASSFCSYFCMLYQLESTDSVKWSSGETQITHTFCVCVSTSSWTPFISSVQEIKRRVSLCCSLHLPRGLSPSSALLEFVHFISYHFLFSLPWLDNCKVATFEKFPLRNIYSRKERVKTYWLETLFSVSFPALMSLVFVLWVVSFLFFTACSFCIFSCCMHDIVYFNLSQESILVLLQLLWMFGNSSE